MADKVVDINSFNKEIHSSEKKESKKPMTNKEIVDIAMGEFKTFLKEAYGFEANYQELRNLMIQLLWAEFVQIVRQELAEEQARQIAEKVKQDNEDTSDQSE